MTVRRIFHLEARANNTLSGYDRKIVAKPRVRRLELIRLTGYRLDVQVIHNGAVANHDDSLSDVFVQLGIRDEFGGVAGIDPREVDPTNNVLLKPSVFGVIDRLFFPRIRFLAITTTDGAFEAATQPFRYSTGWITTSLLIPQLLVSSGLESDSINNSVIHLQAQAVMDLEFEEVSESTYLWAHLQHGLHASRSAIDIGS